MTAEKLTPAQCLKRCDPTQFKFQSTAEIPPVDTIIGQPRAIRALRFGLEIKSPGYNIYIIGETGPGQIASIKRFLRKDAAEKPAPSDWLYVHDFDVTHQAKSISLPAGTGTELKDDLEQLVNTLKRELPEAFETEEYRDEAEENRREVHATRDSLIEELREQAGVDQLTVVSTATGLVIMPLVKGKAMTGDEYNQLPVEEHRQWERKRQAWDEELEKLHLHLRELDQNYQTLMGELDKSVASSVIKHYFDDLEKKYNPHESVVSLLQDIYDDVLESIPEFFQSENDSDGDGRGADLRRYSVNLLVDNSEIEGAPVVVEHYPRYHNLFGRIEYESQHKTHFTNIKAGALHRANGGYLLLNVNDLSRHPNGWQGLKRALKTNQILLQPIDRADGNQVLTQSLDPEPVPLDVKVVLVGTGHDYYRMYSRESDFVELFKVKSEFAGHMERTSENEAAYAAFVAGLGAAEGLRPFDPTAVARLIEYSARMCEHQNRLRTYFEEIANHVREASFWAGQNGRDQVSSADVDQAWEEYWLRVNLDGDLHKKNIIEGGRRIETEGCTIGQINGLSIIAHGDISFGFPSRITVRTYQGESGIVHIERETEMSGPTHDKGLFTLTGYLGGTYAQDRPLSLVASIAFEQSYHGVDGDSASAAELIALLSSLGQIPLKQSLAITGSVDQYGMIQPIGGVNEKIEGFFDICCASGLTGEHGVIIPKQNLVELMLRSDVIEAIDSGRFHLWAIDSIEEGLALFTCVPVLPADEEGMYPEGSLHARVLEGLERLDKDREDDEDEEGEE